MENQLTDIIMPKIWSLIEVGYSIPHSIDGVIPFIYRLFLIVTVPVFLIGVIPKLFNGV